MKYTDFDKDFGKEIITATINSNDETTLRHKYAKALVKLSN